MEYAINSTPLRKRDSLKNQELSQIGVPLKKRTALLPEDNRAVKDSCF